MGLLKRQQDGIDMPNHEVPPALDRQALLAQLSAPQAELRRQAVVELSQSPTDWRALADMLADEPDVGVRERIFTVLGKVAGKEVAESLLPLLRSEDANLRNESIETLAGMPEAVGNLMDDLLRDEDSDVRIFAVNILASLQHTNVLTWLCQVAQEDDEVNVVNAALDVLNEVGDGSCVEAIQNAKIRFPNEPFLHFAADLALDLISQQV